MTAANKKIVSYAIKIAIVVLTLWFAFRKVADNENLKDFVALMRQTSIQEVALVIGAVVVLMLVNWVLEIFKWQRLISSVERISFWRGVESVFCGLTLAIFTPARVGEFGGRVFFLSPRRRIVGVVAMAVGKMGQMVLTNVFGSIAVCVFVYRFVNAGPGIFFGVLILSVAFSLFMLIFYFNINWIKGILMAIRFTRKWEKFYDILGRYSKAELLKILLYSLARYIVFTTQYLILIIWLIPGLHLVDVIMMMCVVYFVQSSLPSLDLFDIGIRSLTAAYFFGFITSNGVEVIAATACIWLINIIIPAILGTYFVFKLNFFGTSKSG